MSYAKAHFHTIFSTKKRQKLISKTTQPKLWAYMAGICANTGIFALDIGGIEDQPQQTKMDSRLLIESPFPEQRECTVIQVPVPRQRDGS